VLVVYPLSLGLTTLLKPWLSLVPPAIGSLAVTVVMVSLMTRC
jgi:antibiotic biosynthesis monooxygenase (ABM) superfamily enzyme